MNHLDSWELILNCWELLKLESSHLSDGRLRRLRCFPAIIGLFVICNIIVKSYLLLVFFSFSLVLAYFGFDFDYKFIFIFGNHTVVSYFFYLIISSGK